MGNCCDVQVFVCFGNRVGQRNGNVVAPNPSLAFTCRIQKSTLHEQEPLAYPCGSLVLTIRIIHCLFEFVAENSVAVDCWRKDKVICFLFDLNVTMRLELSEAMRKSDPEHCFPSYFPGQVVIKLVRKLETIRSC